MLTKKVYMHVRQTASNRNISTLQEAFLKNLDTLTKKISAFRKTHNKRKYQDIELNYLYSGMRQMYASVWQVSEIDYLEGVRFQGLPLKKVMETLPKENNSVYPSIEAFYWLLLTGGIPTEQNVEEMRVELEKRRKISDFGMKLITNKDTFPKELKPVVKLGGLLNLLSIESKFRLAYGVDKKSDYWKSTFEDSLNLMAMMPELVALIYRYTYNKNEEQQQITDKDTWVVRFSKLMAKGDPMFSEYIRLYCIANADQEAGGICTHTSRLIGSALTDPYMSIAGGFWSLGGPEEGVMIKEGMLFVQMALKEVSSLDPVKMRAFIFKYLQSGKRVPGFGHPIMKNIEPAFSLQMEFAKKIMGDDPLYKCVQLLAKVTPPILSELRAIKSPHPNSYLISGVLLNKFGIKEHDTYVMMMGLARTLGITAGFVWDRALGYPLERPKSFSTIYMQQHFIKTDII